MAAKVHKVSNSCANKAGSIGILGGRPILGKEDIEFHLIGGILRSDLWNNFREFH